MFGERSIPSEVADTITKLEATFTPSGFPEGPGRYLGFKHILVFMSMSRIGFTKADVELYLLGEYQI